MAMFKGVFLRGHGNGLTNSGVVISWWQYQVLDARRWLNEDGILMAML
jgi:hypothetical protein